MKTKQIIASTLLVATLGAVATPVVKRADPTETQILQFALTLEHLENAFYKGGLSKYNDAAFEKAGLPSWVRGRIAEIGMHEQTHVEFLSTALGADSVAACKYSFPYTDPKSFVALTQILEGVGVTAYLGGAKYLTDPAVLTAAGAILSTEARHNAWVNSAALKGTPWSGSFDTPLDGNLVYTLASQFIVSCPASNPTLPFTPFPILTVTGHNIAPGQTVKASYQNTGSGTRYMAFMTGLSTEYAQITNGSFKIPQGLQGTVYAVVTNSNGPVTDATTIAGPAILSFPFPASAPNS